MTKDKIRSLYLECIEPRIEAAEEFSDDPYFDKLRDVCNSSYGYSLFYPLTSAFSSNTIDFDALCELYSWLYYCWTDDGSTSFVYTTIESIFNTPIFIKTGPYIHDEWFIMRGERDNLSWDEVEKISLRHDSCEESKMLSYISCVFNKDTLDFLHNLIPKWAIIENEGHQEFKFGEVNKYRDLQKKMDEIFKNYILGNKYLFRKDSRG